jgi:hypothetical protein
VQTDPGHEPTTEGRGAGAPTQRNFKKWLPSTKADFDSRMRAALHGAEDLQLRMNLAWHCWDLMSRIWYRRMTSADARSKWNWFRQAGAVVPVVAAGAGGSLVGHLHGAGGATIGWIALLGGLVGAAIGATRPGVEYAVDVRKAVQYETLYWDIYTYAITKLRTIPAEEFLEQIQIFNRRMEAIALTAEGSTATPS